ncbi:hypothetical protein AVEN_268158-1 [Araneus ventricosus]|uniref:Endonuclease/exonuclease/phosphatase domain-containing protein n=1 Tax=Araneus ventricosus TaxID=182803 RepID=A0A4Y2LUA8_ARAVE|nr:hypothetical protein AVEN_268158-1 [Araneus ventricosus]
MLCSFFQSWTVFPLQNQKKSAITIVNKNFKPSIIVSKKYAVAFKLQTGQNPATFISAYNSPYPNIQETLQELQEIITSLRDESIIIGADLNGHHTMWGYRAINSRGDRILKFLLAKNLFIANSPDAPPTFERGIFKEGQT